MPVSVCHFHSDASVLGAALLMADFFLSCLAAKSTTPLAPAFLRDVVFTGLSVAKPRRSSRTHRAVTRDSEPPYILFFLPVLLFPLHPAGCF